MYSERRNKVLFFTGILFCMILSLAGQEKKRWRHLENFTRIPHFRKSGFFQHFKPDDMKENTPAVILIHGLFMNGYHMSMLAYKLHKHNYYCVTYDYPTIRKGITGHGRDLCEALQDFCRKNPKRQIHIITHSMGGLITRYAAANLPEEYRKQIKSVLMLAPPNKGSAVADLVNKHLKYICSFFPPVVGLQSHKESECRNLPVIPKGIRVGVIAASHDPLVSVESAKLPGMELFMIMEIQTHSSLPFSKKVFRKVREFLAGTSVR